MLTNQFLPSELKLSPLTDAQQRGARQHLRRVTPLRAFDHEYEVLSSCDPSPRLLARAHEAERRSVAMAAYSAVTTEPAYSSTLLAGSQPAPHPIKTTSKLYQPPTVSSQAHTLPNVQTLASIPRPPSLAPNPLTAVQEHRVMPDMLITPVATGDALTDGRQAYLAARGYISKAERESFHGRETLANERETQYRLREKRWQARELQLRARKAELISTKKTLEREKTRLRESLRQVERDLTTKRKLRETLSAENHKTALSLKRQQDREEALALELIKSRTVAPPPPDPAPRLFAPIAHPVPAEALGVSLVFDRYTGEPVAVSSSRLVKNLI